MPDKQEHACPDTAIQTSNMLVLYGTNAYIIHYMLHNLFRGLKPIRRKYKLSINEIIFLNGIRLKYNSEVRVYVDSTFNDNITSYLSTIL